MERDGVGGENGSLYFDGGFKSVVLSGEGVPLEATWPFLEFCSSLKICFSKIFMSSLILCLAHS